MTAPIVMRWNGVSMTPVGGYWTKQANRELVIGQQYAIDIHEERSGASHRHFFAAVNSAWQTLPEGLAERFPSPEALRKYALIKAGFRDERTFVASSKAEALRLAAFVKPMDEFAIVTVAASTVLVLTAKSQSTRAMGRKEFQASKVGVLDVIAGMLGVTAETLMGAEAA